MADTFAGAVEVARQHIPVMQQVRRAECWCGFTIVRKPVYGKPDRFAVYAADAWDEPKSRPLLPWSPPTGTIVGHVAMDGTASEASV